MSLQVKHLAKHFDGVQAVQGVSFEVRPGECVALIGPNGAGKSTAFACIAGQQRLSGGEIWWAGERIDHLSPAQRLRRGVARTFQVAQTFEALTVLQNVQLLLQAPHGLTAWNVLDAQEPDMALALLAQVGLQHLAQAAVLSLPYGAKKRLELALALAGISQTGLVLRPASFIQKQGAGAPDARCASGTAAARLLLLDEPAAGLAGPERAELMRLVKSLAQASPALRQDAATGTVTDASLSGLAVLYTEHNMDAVFGVADRVLVLIDGLLAAQGSAQEIAHNELVQQRYLGRSGAAAMGAGARVCQAPEAVCQPGSGADPGPAAGSSAAASGVRISSGITTSEATAADSPSMSFESDRLLAVQHLNVWYGAAQVLFDVTLDVAAAELVVLQGINGAGKSTLLQAIMGLSPRATGVISYQNKSISNWEPYRRAQLGLGYVAEDRRLFGSLTVQENLRLSARPGRRASAGLEPGAVPVFSEARVLDLFAPLKTMLHRRASEMSGGEQQMLALARTLMTSPRMLLLDEPCEGIAPVLIERIVSALLTLRAQGMPMLVAEQNRWLADQATRVMTLVAGQIEA